MAAWHGQHGVLVSDPLRRARLAITLTLLVGLAGTASSCRPTDKPPGSAGILVYPGSGVPHLSGDVAIDELNTEMSDLATLAVPPAEHRQGSLLFSTRERFDATPGRSVGGERFSCRVAISVSKGKCDLRFGGVLLSVGPTTLDVTAGTKLIGSWSGVRIESFVFERFSRSERASVRVYADGRLVDILRVDFENPAAVALQLAEGTSASIGPWYWVRGYE